MFKFPKKIFIKLLTNMISASKHTKVIRSKNQNYLK